MHNKNVDTILTFSAQNLAKYCSTMDLKNSVLAIIFSYILSKNGYMAITMRKVPRNRDGALTSWIEQDLAQLSTVKGAFCREHLKIMQKKLCKDRFRAVWVVLVAYLQLHRTYCPPVGLSVNRSGNSGHLLVSWVVGRSVDLLVHA